MGCNRCGSPVEQDNLWAICTNPRCGYMSGGDVGGSRGTFIAAVDNPDLPKSEEEVQRRLRERQNHFDR